MRSCELAATITAIACTIANNYSDDELAVLAAAFTQLGDTLGTILAQETCFTNAIDSNNKNSADKDSNKDGLDNNCRTGSADSYTKNSNNNNRRNKNTRN
jgi:hypothetical protein